MTHSTDTICALATAAGGPVAVIRISGPDALAAAKRVWSGTQNLGAPASHRKLLLGSAADEHGGVIDAECLAVYLPGPHSYTGEDVVELQSHGGALAVRLLLQAVISAGARIAEPGEFTRRAFLNGRMELTQAEAVIELIEAGSQAALSLANKQLSGALGAEVNSLYDQLQMTLSEIESRLDFPEEELDWMPTEELLQQLQERRKQMLALAATRREGELLRDGVSMVIAGAPNVGKSSLLNRLLGRDRAIVSAIPGTTRDTIEAELVIRGIPVHLIDTAGFRVTGDTIEAAGIERTRQACQDADVILWLTDATHPGAAPWPEWEHRGALLEVENKCDLARADDSAIAISAQTGEGLEKLFDAFENALFGGKRGALGDAFSGIAVSARHAALLSSAAESLNEAAPLVTQCAWELAAIPLRTALGHLGEITGRAVSPDILDTIFHRFCIGK